ncbi:type VI secretion system Vgr family protein [Comamonas sp. GB3 AK4-5]|uniref:type VI secretion system Vgr family protein n=1 Tax=Comamonas sp. GB3 AK4-5 TaxID=3231487 RepID=UPI00351E514C
MLTAYSADLASLLTPVTLSADARLYRVELAPGRSDSTAAQTMVQALQPEAWIAREALSEIGEIRLLCLSLEADLVLDDLLGQGLLLHTVCADGSLYTRSGLVRLAERLDAQGGLARYRFTLAPWLWLATQQGRSQIFQDRSLADIIEQLLAPYAAQGAVWRCSSDASALLQQIPARSYCTQWRESDYAFLSRLLSEEGLGWRVQPQPEAAWGHEIVIFADSTQDSATPQSQASPARFHRQDAQETDDAVQALARRSRMGASSVSVAIWNPDARSLHEASTQVRTPAAHAPRLAYDHLLGQDDHSKALEGSRAVERSAQRLIEGIEAHSDTFLGHSSLRSAHYGTRLTVQEAPALGLSSESSSAEVALLLDALEQVGFNDLPTGSVQAIEASLGRPEDHLWFDTAPAAPDIQASSLGVSDLAPVSVSETPAADSKTWESRFWEGDQAPLAPDFSAVLIASFTTTQGGHKPRPEPTLIAAARAHGYANRFRASQAALPWRPPLLQPQPSAPSSFMANRPQVFGVHSAIVVGPDGNPQANGADEIYTNARGDVRLRFHWQGEQVQQQDSNPRPDNRSTRWVRVAQRQAGPGLGWQWLPRIGQEVLVKFTDGDPDQPIVISALYNGQGAGGITPTPGGQAAADNDNSLFAQAHDGMVSAQHNLAAGLGGGHAPAWHAASPQPEGHRNATALWGFKSKELGGSGHNQLVFDDSDQQLRVQLASSAQHSQLNLGHVIHQQDNYRGGLRGQGFELRTDGYAAVRGGAGVLLTTYHGPAGSKLEPTADFAPGMALLKQLSTLSEGLDQAAATHQTVRLPGHAGSHKAAASSMDSEHAPHAAMLRTASTLVNADATEQALSQASEKDPSTGDKRVPHTGDAVIAAAAQDGLLAIAGQHMQLVAGEDISLAAGGAINLALNAQARLHTGQAIGLVAAAAKADHDGTGLSIIAAQDAIDVQAQSSTLKVQAKEQLTLQSANAAVEIAASRKLRIATAQGAAIELEGGSITFEAPGTITYKTSMRTLQGPVRGGYALPLFPQSVCVACLLKAAQSGSPFAIHQ